MQFVFAFDLAAFWFFQFIQLDWFMNRNISPRENIIWHSLPNSYLLIASFKYDGTSADVEFLNFLSDEEKEKANKLPNQTEFRHYITRRCFQRLFLANVLSTTIVPQKLAIIHQRDTQPVCADAPGLNFSFSSSGTTALACASWNSAVGIDIEKLRKVENVVALARRHFAVEEAEALAMLPEAQQTTAFLHYWTAKEAGLKAIGKGIVFGLNTFVLKTNGRSYELLCIQPNSTRWNVHFPEIVPNHLIAVVTIKPVETP